VALPGRRMQQKLSSPRLIAVAELSSSCSSSAVGSTTSSRLQNAYTTTSGRDAVTSRHFAADMSRTRSTSDISTFFSYVRRTFTATN